MDSRLLVLGLVVVLAAPSVASAAPTAAQRETARRLMDEGKEKLRAGDKERAIDAYRKAHDLMHVPTTGMALAKAHLSVGHLVEARDVALEVTRMQKEPGEPKVFDQARREAKEMEASLKPRIPTVRIVVKNGPATKVTVDDVEVAPLLLGEPVALNPGHHVVVAKNADGVEKRAEVDLAEREAKETVLDVPPAKPAVVTAPVEQAPKAVSYGPAEPRGDRSGAANVLLYGGFGLAAAGLAVGAVTGAMTLGKAGEVKTQCENGICAPEAASDLDGARTLGTVSTIAFAVAGAGVVMGVVGLALPKTNAETALHSNGQRRAQVFFGPGSAGVRGSF